MQEPTLRPVYVSSGAALHRNLKKLPEVEAGQKRNEASKSSGILNHASDQQPPKLQRCGAQHIGAAKKPDFTEIDLQLKQDTITETESFHPDENSKNHDPNGTAPTRIIAQNLNLKSDSPIRKYKGTWQLTPERRNATRYTEKYGNTTIFERRCPRQPIQAGKNPSGTYLKKTEIRKTSTGSPIICYEEMIFEKKATHGRTQEINHEAMIYEMLKCAGVLPEGFYIETTDTPHKRHLGLNTKYGSGDLGDVQKGFSKYIETTTGTKPDFMTPLYARAMLQLIIDSRNVFEELFKQGYAHYDVKKQNLILYEGKGMPIDYGCADLRDNGKDRYGTQLNRAPELLDSNSKQDKADVWGLGTVLADLFLEKRIFEFTNMDKQSVYDKFENLRYDYDGYNKFAKSQAEIVIENVKAASSSSHSNVRSVIVNLLKISLCTEANRATLSAFFDALTEAAAQIEAIANAGKSDNAQDLLNETSVRKSLADILPYMV